MQRFLGVAKNVVHVTRRRVARQKSKKWLRII